MDSETSIGLISTPPGPYPQQAVVPPKEMAHIRDEVNRVAGSQRMLAHGLATPQLGRKDGIHGHAGRNAQGGCLEVLHGFLPRGV